MKKLQLNYPTSWPWLALTLALLLSARPVRAGTNTVTNLNGSGPGSLAQAIAVSTNGDTIKFTVAGTIPGGLVINKNLTITGPGATNLSISGAGPVISINAGTTGSISGLTIRDGNSDGFGLDGGGLYNGGTLTLTACTISGNTAVNAGGGIYNVGTLTLTTCTISGNLVQDPGSGGHVGGGIANAGGTLTLTTCTINGNSATGNNASGGGINSLGSLTLTGCTISGNSAGGGGGGGGVYVGGTGTLTGCTISGNSAAVGGGLLNGGTLALTTCTISGNSAVSGGGGIDNNPGETLTLTSCTVSGNSVTANIGGGLSGPCILRNTLVAGNNPDDIADPVTSQGHNLIGQSDGSKGITNGVNSDLTGTSANPLAPKLGALADNSGPTPTVGLWVGSPAIDAGDDSLLGAPFNLTTDQRGFPRKAGAHVDIGAFELLRGDINNDGVVDQTDLNALLGNYNNGAVDQSALDSVLARYWPTSPWLLMTNTAGLGTTNVQFALPYPTAWNFTVEVSSNLSSWIPLGPAFPTYQFGDPAATNAPQRCYRLRYP